MRRCGIAPGDIEREREANAGLEAALDARGVGHFPRGQRDQVALAAGDHMFARPGLGEGGVEVGHKVADVDVVRRGKTEARRRLGRQDRREAPAVGELHREVRIIGQLAVGRGGEGPHQHGGAAQRKGLAGDVVARAVLRLVDQDGVAGQDLDAIVAGTGVDPHRLLHGRADRDLVVAAQSVDDDREEVTLGGQQLADQLAGLVVELDLVHLDAVCRLGTERADAEQDVVGLPDVVALAVAAAEVQAHLGIERIVAVVIGEARHQVVVGQQARLGHVVDADHVVGIGRADVPDLVGLPGVFLPVVAAETAVDRLEGGAVDPHQGVVAAVAVEETQARTAVQHVRLGGAQHAVEAGVLQVVGDVGVRVVVEPVAVTVAIGRRQAAVRTLEDAELAGIEHDGLQSRAGGGGRGPEDEAPVDEVRDHPTRQVHRRPTRVAPLGQRGVEVGHQVAQPLLGHAHRQAGVDRVRVVVGGLGTQVHVERLADDVVAEVVIEREREGRVAKDATVRPGRRPALEDQVTAGTVDALTVAEPELRLQRVGIQRPGIHLVRALATEQVVVALTAKQPVVIRRGSDAGAAVAPEAVIAAKADQDVAASAAIQTVPPGSSAQDVVARATIEHADKVVAAVVERREVERDFTADTAVGELDRVVAEQARHPELFDKEVVTILPLRLESALEQGVAGIQRIDRLVVHLQQVGVGRVLHQPDAVVLGTALDQQDVCGVVVRDIPLALVAEVAIEILGGGVDGILRARVEHQHVDAGATVQRIAVVLAFQPVGVGAAPEDVVAATAEELVLAAAAEQDVSTTNQ